MTKYVVMLIAAPFFAIAGALVDGFVVAHLWRWFVVPTFALPPLAMWQAAGLGLLAGWLSYQSAQRKDDRSGLEMAVEVIYALTLRPLAYLAIGWVILGVLR
jgi:hypothetical protein